MIPGIERELHEYLDRHPEDFLRLAGLCERVDRGDDLSQRSDMLGHAVASMLTLDRTRSKGLLIHHAAYGLWIPPGGHHEDGQTLHETALRERFEETGLADSRPPRGRPHLLDIDTHPIPERPSKGEGVHVHHDFMYLDLFDGDFDPVIQEEEVHGAQWVDLDAMAGERMQRLVRRIRDMPAEDLA